MPTKKPNDRILRRAEYIAFWMKHMNSVLEAKSLLDGYSNPFGEAYFHIFKDADGLFDVGIGCNVDYGIRSFIEDLAGKDFVNSPENDIFYTEDDNQDSYIDGKKTEMIDGDKIDDYYASHPGKKYLEKFNLIVFRENTPFGTSVTTFPVFVISLDTKRVFMFDYESYHEGDDAYLEYCGFIRF